MKIRLQKYLAMNGIASRRAAEVMITEGRVKLNGKIATLGQSAGPNDKVTVDGNQIAYPVEQERLIMLHKPKGTICTKKDPEGRKSVFSLLPPGNWVMVGRLDYQTEGLLLFSESGDKAHQLMHPSFGNARVYRVKAFGDRPDLTPLTKGLEIKAGFVKAKSAILEQSNGRQHWLKITLEEGKNREIRDMLEAVGLTVSRLIRVQYGPYQLGKLKEGQWVDIS